MFFCCGMEYVKTCPRRFVFILDIVQNQALNGDGNIIRFGLSRLHVYNMFSDYH